MKKTEILIISLILTFFFMPGISFSSQRYSVSSDRLNVRSGPGTKYEILWQAEKNYPLAAVEDKGQWIHFKDFEGYEGWAYKPLLSKKRSVVIKIGKCNIRKGPGTNYPVIFTAEKGTPFLVTGSKNGWYKLLHSDGDTGWAKKTLLW